MPWGEDSAPKAPQLRAVDKEAQRAQLAAQLAENEEALEIEETARQRRPRTTTCGESTKQGFSPTNEQMLCSPSFGSVPSFSVSSTSSYDFSCVP